jgi:hypothetical protein
MGNKVTVNANQKKSDLLAFLKHELRHVYQSDFENFQIKGNNFYYKGEKSISISTYQKILRGAQRGENESYKKYINLPWEKDADDYAGILRQGKSLIVGEFFTVDLIELPPDLLIELQ